MEEKGMAEDEMVGFGDGQGSLACCSPWSHKESDPTEWLKWLTDDIIYHIIGLGKI